MADVIYPTVGSRLKKNELVGPTVGPRVKEFLSADPTVGSLSGVSSLEARRSWVQPTFASVGTQSGRGSSEEVLCCAPDYPKIVEISTLRAVFTNNIINHVYDQFLRC